MVEKNILYCKCGFYGNIFCSVFLMLFFFLLLNEEVWYLVYVFCDRDNLIKSYYKYRY